MAKRSLAEKIKSEQSRAAAVRAAHQAANGSWLPQTVFLATPPRGSVAGSWWASCAAVVFDTRILDRLGNLVETREPFLTALPLRYYVR